LIFYNTLTNGTLGNNAIKGSGPSLNYVAYIGGPKDGYSMVTVTVTNSGMYNLKLLYRHDDTSRPIKVDVNGINTGVVYSMPKGNPAIFNILISLNSGQNTIKFHGDGVNYAPDLGVFYLEPVVTRNPPQLPSGTYDLSFGTFFNGASLGKGINAQYASNLGGPKDGSVTVEVTVSASRLYKVSLNYINIDTNIRFMKIGINGVDVGVSYVIPPSEKGKFSALLWLQSGKNTLKFHGDGASYAPDLKLMTLAIPTDLTVNAALTNGAISSLGVISNIGGPSDGTVTINYNASKAGKYKLTALGDASNVLPLINLNGSDIAQSYNIETITSEMKRYTVLVNLNMGNNIIKFHGNKTSFSPKLYYVDLVLIANDFIITNITPTPTTIPGTTTMKYSIATGVLTGGAKLELDSKLAGWLGGPTDGASTIKVNVSGEGVYNLAIEYIDGDGGRPLVIDVNGVNTGSIYRTIKTTGWTLADTKTITVPVTLKNGENTLKFHGNGKDYAPSLAGLTLIKVASSIIALNFINGILTGGAKLVLENKLVGWIGGPNDGASTLTANVDSVGMYNLVIEYLDGDGGRPFKLDINGISTGISYRAPRTPSWNLTDTKTVTIPVNFDKLTNTIKIHGDGINYSGDFGKVTITKQAITKNFSTSMGKVETILMGGAYIENGFFKGIAGVALGEVNINVYAPYSGKYDFAIEYVTMDDTNKVQISVNNVSTNELYSFEATKSIDIVHKKIKVIQLDLVAGNNTIRIY
ncbi:MAG: hypothetical protein ACRC7R_07965, partial [Sarcina sp.]